MTDDFDPAMNGGPNGGEEGAMRAEAGEGAMTPMLDQAIRAARSLPEDDQDALAAAMLEWMDDQRRWADSFARTQEALVELAREALAEDDPGHDLDGPDDSPVLPEPSYPRYKSL